VEVPINNTDPPNSPPTLDQKPIKSSVNNSFEDLGVKFKGNNPPVSLSGEVQVLEEKLESESKARMAVELQLKELRSVLEVESKTRNALESNKLKLESDLFKLRESEQGARSQLALLDNQYRELTKKIQSYSDIDTLQRKIEILTATTAELEKVKNVANDELQLIRMKLENEIKLSAAKEEAKNILVEQVKLLNRQLEIEYRLRTELETEKETYRNNVHENDERKLQLELENRQLQQQINELLSIIENNTQSILDKYKPQNNASNNDNNNSNNNYSVSNTNSIPVTTTSIPNSIPLTTTTTMTSTALNRKYNIPAPVTPITSTFPTSLDQILNELRRLIDGERYRINTIEQKLEIVAPQLKQVSDSTNQRPYSAFSTKRRKVLFSVNWETSIWAIFCLDELFNFPVIV